MEDIGAHFDRPIRRGMTLLTTIEIEGLVVVALHLFITLFTVHFEKVHTHVRVKKNQDKWAWHLYSSRIPLMLQPYFCRHLT